MGRRAEDALNAARTLAEDARANLRSQLGVTRDRLSPGELKQDAADIVNTYIEDATQVTVDTVKEHPVAFGASFLGTLAFWYRRPIAEKSPAAIDSVSDGLARLRDWIAPENWSSNPPRNDD